MAWNNGGGNRGNGGYQNRGGNRGGYNNQRGGGGYQNSQQNQGNAQGRYNNQSGNGGGNDNYIYTNTFVKNFIPDNGPKEPAHLQPGLTEEVSFTLAPERTQEFMAKLQAAIANPDCDGGIRISLYCKQGQNKQTGEIFDSASMLVLGKFPPQNQGGNGQWNRGQNGGGRRDYQTNNQGGGGYSQGQQGYGGGQQGGYQQQQPNNSGYGHGQQQGGPSNGYAGQPGMDRGAAGGNGGGYAGNNAQAPYNAGPQNGGGYAQGPQGNMDAGPQQGQMNGQTAQNGAYPSNQGGAGDVPY